MVLVGHTRRMNMRCLTMTKRRCKSPNCRAELTDPSKGYCSRHIYHVERLKDTVEWLTWRRWFEAELAKQDEEHAEYEADL